MKKPNIKSFFANHTEKLVFGMFGFFILLALYNTSWGKFPKTPEELKLEAGNVRARITDAKNVWPDGKLYKVVDFTDKAKQLFSPIDYERFRLQTPLFHALNKVDEPRREPVFEPVEALMATVALVPLGVREQQEDPATTTPDPQIAAANKSPTDDVDSDFKPRGPAAATPGGPAGGPVVPGGGQAPFGAGMGGRSLMFSGDDEERVGNSGPAMAGMGPMGSLSGIKARGVRVIAVRGVFPLQKQLQHYVDALHVTKSDASRDFELADFVLERQVAVPGSDPWKDVPWLPVRVESAWDVLLEAAEIDREDPVPLNMKDPVITMELPYRLFGTWEKLASHTRIEGELLSKKELEEQNNLLDAMDATAAENGLQPKLRKRGLASYQADPKAMAKAMKGNPAMVQRLNSQMTGSKPPTAGGVPTQPNMAGRVMDDDDERTGIMGLGRGSASFTFINKVLNDSNYLLFRYLDFDVQSGYAYRYRVRLKFRNPNFEVPPELLGGADPSIANGEERESPWSNVSNPQVVPQTTNYFLEDVGRDPYREEKLRMNEAIPAAMVSIFDWDMNYGSVVASDPLNPPKVLTIGSYIGDKYLEESKEKKEVKAKEEARKVERKNAAFGMGLGDQMAGDEMAANAAAQQNAQNQTGAKKDKTTKRNELKILDFKEGGLVTKKHYFSTLDVLLDVEPDAEIQIDQHPDLKFPLEKLRGGIARVNLVEEAIVTTSNGDLKILDPITTKGKKEEIKDRVAKERRLFKDVELLAANRANARRSGDEETVRGRPVNRPRRRFMMGGRGGRGE